MTEKIYPMGRTLKIAKRYNAKQFLEFTKNKAERYELIEGIIYMMASPSVEHQDLAGNIYSEILQYLKGKPCRVFIAPLDVILFEKSKENKKNEENEDDSQNVFQPDIFVVCDSKKIAKNTINGAPDLIIEIVSPSNPENDYIYKLNAYIDNGVREYWIVNPGTKSVTVYVIGEDFQVYNYTFENKVKVNIFEDFEIDFKELKW